MRKLFFGDNLQVLARYIPERSIDLVYLDPPFNSRKSYRLWDGGQDSPGFRSGAQAFGDTWQWGEEAEKEYAALVSHPDGRVALVVESLSKVLGGTELMAYLVMMGGRLLELRRVLSPTGSLYLHCDPSASHYLKFLLDAVFGAANFRNEIVWHYYNKYSAGKNVFPRSYDQIFFYTMGESYTFHPQREPREKPVKQLLRENVGGVLKNKKDAHGKTMTRWAHDRKVDSVWRIPCVQYASPEFMGYPTQKPLALLERIILASSNPGDLVLDPFSGCGTALHAAENLGRSWVGIDASPLAIAAMEQRLGVAFPALVLQKTDFPAGPPVTPGEATGAASSSGKVQLPTRRGKNGANHPAKKEPDQQSFDLGPLPAMVGPHPQTRGDVVKLPSKPRQRKTAQAGMVSKDRARSVPAK